jgi:enolase
MVELMQIMVLEFKEFMIRPDRAKSFSEAMRICFIVIKNLSKLIKDKGLSTSVGDEGGFCTHDK